ncbi:MAG: glyoxylate/hydroxypyruvate reductase A, partial [Rhodospirillales bacterium]|nr:glyoxylate/hydroxypyruvate reductase A [Rhodospirillales bacterium]
MTGPIRVAYFSIDDPVEPWRDLCRTLTPPVRLQAWPDEIDDPADIEAAFVWHAPPAMWVDLPNLRFVQTIGTGVDHLLAHP